MKRIFPVLCSVLAACSVGAGGDDASLESDYRVHPRGSQSSGKLKVLLPPGVTTSSFASTTKVELFAEAGGRSTSVPLSTEVSIAPGTVCVRLRVAQLVKSWSSSWSYEEAYAEGATDCGVVIKAGQTTTYTLSVVSFSQSEEVFGMPDVFKEYVRWSSVDPDAPKCTRAGAANGDTSALLHCSTEAGRKRPLLPGTYTYSWGVADGFTTTFAAGDVRAIDLADVASSGRRVVRVVPPAHVLPDAAATTYQVAGNGKTLSKMPVAGKPIQIGQSADAAGVATTFAVLVGGANEQRRDVWFPAAGSAASSLAIERLDVDAVTMSDGGTTHGSYGVDRADGTSFVTVVPGAPGLRTGTGIDVLAGSYRIVTSYTRLDGSTGTDSQNVAVP